MPRAVAERGDVVPVLAEVFRSHGFDGASLAVITEHTGLGKGSLYNFFPRGKDEMAEAVLDEVDAWFQTAVYRRLREPEPAAARLERMFDEVETYFRSGRRICLFGAFALGLERDRFAHRVRAYFTDWVDSLAGALADAGHGTQSRPLAEEVVAGIQGALVLARALDDPGSFTRILTRLRRSVADPTQPRA
ncbi:TetR/AcrR family transcriptional regulator [Rhodococcus sp. IEGM 248]|nr:TetR/AcrR family transcriptional regulator [Rhodococcus sp. IEGM 248]